MEDPLQGRVLEPLKKVGHPADVLSTGARGCSLEGPEVGDGTIGVGNNMVYSQGYHIEKRGGSKELEGGTGKVLCCEENSVRIELMEE